MQPFQMYLIDTHAHIYLSDFDADRPQMLEASKNMGISNILMPAIDSFTHEKMLQVEGLFEGCRAMMGLHPCSVSDTMEKELTIVESWLKQKKFIAIGEIGLDFYWDKTFTTQQYEAFHRQIEFALQEKIPIVIHSRNAIDECIEIIKKYPELTGVFHCFAGTVAQAMQIMESKFLLGIGGVVTFKNAGLDKVISETGIDHVVLETDAPYLAPVPFRGKRNETPYLKYIVEKIGMITGKTPDEVARITSLNAKNIFRLV
jgi:TatD DNase family protein